MSTGFAHKAGYIRFRNARTINPATDEEADITDGTFKLTLSPEADTGVITAATNASPIVITSASHGLSNGDNVTIMDVNGNTAAVGFWTVANVTTDTFELSGSTGNGTFVADGDPRWHKSVSGLHNVDMTRSGNDYYYLLPDTADAGVGTYYAFAYDTTNPTHGYERKLLRLGLDR